jgi:hypothetical protein
MRSFRTTSEIAAAKASEANDASASREAIAIRSMKAWKEQETKVKALEKNHKAEMTSTLESFTHAHEAMQKQWDSAEAHFGTALAATSEAQEISVRVETQKNRVLSNLQAAWLGRMVRRRLRAAFDCWKTGVSCRRQLRTAAIRILQRKRVSMAGSAFDSWCEMIFTIRTARQQISITESALVTIESLQAKLKGADEQHSKLQQQAKKIEQSSIMTSANEELLCQELQQLKLQHQGMVEETEQSRRLHESRVQAELEALAKAHVIGLRAQHSAAAEEDVVAHGDDPWYSSAESRPPSQSATLGVPQHETAIAQMLSEAPLEGHAEEVLLRNKQHLSRTAYVESVRARLAQERAASDIGHGEHMVRAISGRLSGLSVYQSKSVLYDVLVWAHMALNNQKRRFLAWAEHAAGAARDPSGASIAQVDTVILTASGSNDSKISV